MGKRGWEWFAGVFEGEGTIVFIGKKSVRICIRMTDEDVLHHCCSIAGVGSVRSIHSPSREATARKVIYTWEVSAASDVESVLREIRPYLGERRGQRADEALVRLASVRRPGQCSRGHEMVGTNLHVSINGKRHCRKCMRIRYERKRQRANQA